MSLSSKSAVNAIPRLMAYRRPLHPELFDLQGRRIDRHGDYEIESWITSGGHVVRFNYAGQVMSETVVDAAGSESLPESGLVHALPCIGEKEYDHTPEGKIGYFVTIQTENLADNLYQSTFREMEDFAQETNGLSHVWEDEAGRHLSMLDAQKYRNEFHFQSYHLNATNGHVLRTQSIFEVLDGK
ncbi:MAG: DUF2617 family protein [Planctomycetota bacterium]